jgi:hypothetical protein
MPINNYKVTEQPYEISITPSLVPMIVGLVITPIAILYILRGFPLEILRDFNFERAKILFHKDPFSLFVLLALVSIVISNLVLLVKMFLGQRIRVDRVARTIFKSSHSVATFDEIEKLSVKKPALSRTATLSLLLKNGKTMKLLTGNNPAELKEIAQKIGVMVGVPVVSA